MRKSPPDEERKDRKDRKAFLSNICLCALSVLCVLDVSGRVRAQSPGSGRDKGWRDFGGGPSASKFVDLDQIKKSNVGQRLTRR